MIYENRCLKIGSYRRGRCGMIGVEEMVVSSMTGVCREQRGPAKGVPRTEVRDLKGT